MTDEGKGACVVGGGDDDAGAAIAGAFAREGARPQAVERKMAIARARLPFARGPSS